jgi:dTDP-4-dehydrorhamnose reductase
LSKALIIGASGYLGGRLLSEPFADAVLGTFFTNQKQGLDYLDLRDHTAINGIMDRIGPDLVLFPAGVTDVDRCEKDPELAFKVNSDAAAVISNHAGVKLVYYSSDYVFDGNHGGYHEDSEPTPINTYGRSKLGGENAVLRSGAQNLVLRVSGLFGPSGVKADRFDSQLNRRGHFQAEDDRFSSPVFLEDVVAATRVLLKEGASGIFHVAGPHVLSRYEFQQLLAHFSSASWRPDPVTSTMMRRDTPRPRNSSLSTRRLYSLGWNARSVAAALHETFASSEATSIAERDVSELLRYVEKADPEVILVDCIGGVLTERLWLPSDSLIDALDLQCGQEHKGPELALSNRSVDSTVGGATHLHERVVQKYAPNPIIWPCLKQWKQRHKLVMANDGISATFRMWVNRYGLDLIFDDVINSAESGLRKSESDFYRFFAKRMKVDLNRFLLIDDDQLNIDAAAKSGVAVLHTHPLNEFPLLGHGITLR